jgi:hypothetical protein
MLEQPHIGARSRHTGEIEQCVVTVGGGEGERRDLVVGGKRHRRER